MYRYYKKIGNTERISSWKSKGLSDEIIKPTTTSDNSLTPALSYIGNKARVKFDGGCLKQDKITFTHGLIVNIYIVYELRFSNHRYDGYPTLENSLLGAVKATKNVDIDKYKYSWYGISLDRRGPFSFHTGAFGCNVIIFGVDMSSFVHVEKLHILILGEGPRLYDTSLASEKKYSINFTVNRNKFCLSLHYNEENSFYLLIAQKLLNSKPRTQSNPIPLCLGKTSKDFCVDNMKKTGLNGYVYNFSVDYDAIAVDDILGIYNI